MSKLLPEQNQQPQDKHMNEKSTMQARSAVNVAFNGTYLNSRQIYVEEQIIFEGPVKIEDRAQALKGKILLKDRFAVLCPSRLLLFKNVQSRWLNETALAVYPIARSDFQKYDAPALTELNFASHKNFQTGVDSLQNYTHFVRMSFRDASPAVCSIPENISPGTKGQSRNTRRPLPNSETMAV